MRKYSFASYFKSMALVFGIGLALASCTNEDIVQNQKGKDDDTNLTSFSTGDPTTRTSMESNGTFYWESGDKIWVKDDNGTWQQSSNAPTEKTASFEFKVPGKFTKSSTYKVYYTGQNGNKDQVLIAANQSQTEPNTTAHFGASGDCGMADAAWSNAKNSFTFALDHKAAYLLLLPRTATTVLYDCYITKVEINSDNDITSTYTLDPTTGELTGTGTGKQIIVSTGGSGTYANGFPLTNNATSAATNGTYVVIKPGVHTLKIRYWVKDMVTKVEGAITKTLPSTNYDQNKYYNITANLDVKNYDGDHYYMWDAQKQYWYGYEWTKHLSGNTGQPTLNYNSSSNYPQSNSDVSRWYNESFPGYGVSNPATHTSCKDLPNVNEMTWYAAKGEPRWDADELWTTMGHLYKGGMWFKKKANISGFNPNTAEDGTDWRTNVNVRSWSVSQTLPDAADAGNYFYLPALGFYGDGFLTYIGSWGYYWSSSAIAWDRNMAWALNFTGSSVFISVTNRTVGGSVEPTFE
mgnify:CR=1 FL=1